MNESVNESYEVADDLEWLKSISPKVADALHFVCSERARYFECCREGYEYRYVNKAQFNDSINDLREKKVITCEGKLIGPAKLSADQRALFIYQNGSAYKILNHLIVIKRMGMVHLLDGLLGAAKSENLLVLITCMRSALEHIGHSEFLIGQVGIGEIPEGFSAANELLTEKNDLLVKAIGATRIDWKNFASQKSGEPLKKRDIKYKPSEMLTDLTAPQVLNGVDKLDKKAVDGTRAVYEILCEFAHPNVGLFFSLTESAISVEDKRHQFLWIEKKLSLHAPVSFLTECSSGFEKIFEVFVGCLKRFDEQCREFEDMKKPYLALTQVVTRSLVEKNHDVIWAYSECPCGSGKKVRFCCGSKSENQ